MKTGIDEQLLRDVLDNRKDISFLTESNAIEGIFGEPLPTLVDHYQKFLKLEEVTINDALNMLRYVDTLADIRDITGRNVRVGKHIPPAGGIAIGYALTELLASIKHISSWEFHVKFETLHPFTDGNGRVGRILWAWKRVREDTRPSNFLQTFYYQTLDSSR